MTIATHAHTRDTHGNETSGAAEKVAAYDHALDRLLRYHPDVLPAAEEIAADPAALPMGQVFTAYLALMSTDSPDVAAAQDAAASLAALPLNDREAAHAAAVTAWVEGRWHDAARTLDELLVRWPADVLALLMGHLLDFFLGDAQNLRDRVGRSLPNFDPDHPHTGFVRGMHAFGLEESGHYERAARVGLAAVERNPDDVWGIHAVVHALEMQGKVDDGIRFLRSREKDWGSGNLFTVHNWWHLALYLLEAGRHDEVLAIYDAQVHNAQSAGVPIEMLDAGALLWRLTLDGIDTQGRFGPLADAWANRVGSESWYVFNDLHAVIALSGAGRLDEARAVVEELTRYVAAAPAHTQSNVMMTAEVGLPTTRAVIAFSEGRHDDAVKELWPVRARFHRFGGSHAQRDVLQRTLTDSAIRSGQHELARALLNERLSQRDTSIYGLRRQASVLRSVGAADAATASERRAGKYQATFAAAAGRPMKGAVR
ncbi:MAG: tetratricopeptide repeat protein [Acidimicrobiia bacterium]